MRFLVIQDLGRSPFRYGFLLGWFSALLAMNVGLWTYYRLLSHGF